MEFFPAVIHWAANSLNTALVRATIALLSLPGVLWGSYLSIRFLFRRDNRRPPDSTPGRNKELHGEYNPPGRPFKSKRLETSTSPKQPRLLVRIIVSLYVAILGPACAGVASLYVYDRYFKSTSVSETLSVSDPQSGSDSIKQSVKPLNPLLGAPADQSASIQRPVLSSDPCEAASDHWRSTENIGSIEAYSDHLKRFPNCQFAELARDRIAELKDQAEKQKITARDAETKIRQDAELVRKFILNLLDSKLNSGGSPVREFYRNRGFEPLWITNGKLNARANEVISYLESVSADGLDPNDYPVPHISGSEDQWMLAEGELKLTNSVIMFAHHAQIGRVHWSRIGPSIFYNEAVPNSGDVLGRLAAATDVAAALDSYEPHAPGYLALKSKLADIRTGKGDGTKPPIPNGPVLKIGDQDGRVPQVREKLGVLGDSATYDKPLAEAVKKFQVDHALKVTGTLTSATLDAINGPYPSHEVDTIIANMERWRWMPHDLGKTYIIVNLPDFTLRVTRDDKQVWMTKITIGRPEMPTPIISAEMKFIRINPIWVAPSSIVNSEYLPALRQDPTVLARMGMKLIHNGDGTIKIYELPSDRGVLGRLQFNFPNKFAVDQHDTGDKFLFAYDRRAFDRCDMRVQDPVKYAEVLLSLVRPGDGYTGNRIRSLFGSGEIDIQLPTFIPVHLTYQTAFVDDEGKLYFREDIYGVDGRILAVLKNGEHNQDAPVAQPEVKLGDDCGGLNESATAANGSSEAPLFGGRVRLWDPPPPNDFFSRLFGGQVRGGDSQRQR
jgi:murein L,D-transpeptidase YcbB/YkuD